MADDCCFWHTVCAGGRVGALHPGHGDEVSGVWAGQESPIQERAVDPIVSLGLYCCGAWLLLVPLSSFEYLSERISLVLVPSIPFGVKAAFYAIALHRDMRKQEEAAGERASEG